jgi:hypothetical protein
VQLGIQQRPVSRNSKWRTGSIIRTREIFCHLSCLEWTLFMQDI